MIIVGVAALAIVCFFGVQKLAQDYTQYLEQEAQQAIRVAQIRGNLSDYEFTVVRMNMQQWAEQYLDDDLNIRYSYDRYYSAFNITKGSVKTNGFKQFAELASEKEVILIYETDGYFWFVDQGTRFMLK